MTGHLYQRLQPELQICVLELLSQGDLANVCLVSREFYNLANKILYKTIDLACHYPEPTWKRTGRIETSGPAPQWKGPGDQGFKRLSHYLSSATGVVEAVGDCFPADLYEGQFFLIRTLVKLNPALGRHVRQLRWTAGVPMSDETRERWCEPLDELDTDTEMTKQEIEQCRPWLYFPWCNGMSQLVTIHPPCMI